ncbi:nucleotide exchange factor GrpE [Candidatus Peregrinibacteria bacterium]|nr:nucleotide exchange factor GrpE [Candidatus Peregrinibacteria bacterium]MBT3599050.1 nucleotide exchange factor GrpE [Candidatus Peregrinibacteria bacterium]MBT4367287.1 nucleotide exchange factor GrpE [Candidatus Peregrinibacteria bacterium]MBT4585598.1 nucleotide exchange factor GrpE [Candidatus Peregrinibacteria bacterium]MBT6730644.1 nucleotide exchange factor GrpE [Candidatus Peregrinibacteria bacterium]
MESNKDDKKHAASKKVDPNIAKLQKDLEDAINECEQMKNLAARSQADLQNAKARMEKEAASSHRYAVEKMLTRLIPTIDNFQRAFSHLPEELKDHEWVKGLQAIEQGFIEEMQAVGLQKISSLNEKADPEKHEVLKTGPGEEGMITEVFEEGYMLHEKVLRPARVVVGEG